ncbi:DEAD/DEAH box helicase, partial [Acinetobacter baumannii]
AIPLITGKAQITSEAEVWHWLSNPLPPGKEHHIVQQIRDYLSIDNKSFGCSHRFEDLDYMIQSLWLSECMSADFFKENNPILRHTVLRKRK